MGLRSSPTLPRYLLLSSLLLSLLFVCLILALTRDGSLLSLTTFSTGAAYGSMTYSLGYSLISECWTSAVNPLSNECKFQSLQEYDVALGGVCHRGGVGLIAMYSLSLPLLLVLIAVTACASRLSSAGSTKCHPLLSLSNLSSLLSLVLLTFAIVPIAVWYSSCQATLSNSHVTYADDPSTKWPIDGLRVGSGMGLAIVAAVLALATVCLSAWRSIREYREAKNTTAAVVGIGEELLPTFSASKWGKAREDSASTAITNTFVSDAV